MRRGVLASLLFLTLTGCAHGARRGGGYMISSVGSEYSPAVRLSVTVADATDSVVVMVAGGTVIAPGHPAPDAPAIMRRLEIEALLVSAARSVPGAPVEPWALLAASATQPLADSLHLGVAEDVRPLRFAIARPHALDPRRSWLVFRISGEAISEPIRYADGTLLPGRSMPGGVRVFACADRSLAGAVDRKRAAALATGYVTAC